MLSMKLKASLDQYVEITNSETTILETQSATAGTLALFCAPNSRGMSCDLPAAKSTSAQINVQARKAPSTETSTPTEIITAPQCPTASSRAPARDGFATPAIAARGATAYGNSVIATMRPVTATKPSIVAEPTSERFLAKRE